MPTVVRSNGKYLHRVNVLGHVVWDASLGKAMTFDDEDAARAYVLPILGARWAVRHPLNEADYWTGDPLLPWTGDAYAAAGFPSRAAAAEKLEEVRPGWTQALADKGTPLVLDEVRPPVPLEFLDQAEVLLAGPPRLDPPVRRTR